MSIENRGTVFGESCRAFDYDILSTYYSKFSKYRSEGKSLEEIQVLLRGCTVSQLVTMSAAWNVRNGQKQGEVEAPMKMDDVRHQIPTDLGARVGPFGVATLRCEQCAKRFTLKKGQYKRYEGGEIPLLLCVDCQYVNKYELSTGSS